MHVLHNNRASADFLATVEAERNARMERLKQLEEMRNQREAKMQSTEDANNSGFRRTNRPVLTRTSRPVRTGRRNNLETSNSQSTDDVKNYGSSIGARQKTYTAPSYTTTYDNPGLDYKPGRSSSLTESDNDAFTKLSPMLRSKSVNTVNKPLTLYDPESAQETSSHDSRTAEDRKDSYNEDDDNIEDFKRSLYGNTNYQPQTTTSYPWERPDSSFSSGYSRQDNLFSNNSGSSFSSFVGDRFSNPLDRSSSFTGFNRGTDRSLTSSFLPSRESDSAYSSVPSRPHLTRGYSTSYQPASSEFSRLGQLRSESMDNSKLSGSSSAGGLIEDAKSRLDTMFNQRKSMIQSRTEYYDNLKKQMSNRVKGQNIFDSQNKFTSKSIFDSDEVPSVTNQRISVDNILERKRQMYQTAVTAEDSEEDEVIEYIEDSYNHSHEDGEGQQEEEYERVEYIERGDEEVEYGEGGDEAVEYGEGGEVQVEVEGVIDEEFEVITEEEVGKVADVEVHKCLIEDTTIVGDVQSERKVKVVNEDGYYEVKESVQEGDYEVKESVQEGDYEVKERFKKGHEKDMERLAQGTGKEMDDNDKQVQEGVSKEVEDNVTYSKESSDRPSSVINKQELDESDRPSSVINKQELDETDNAEETSCNVDIDNAEVNKDDSNPSVDILISVNVPERSVENENVKEDNTTPGKLQGAPVDSGAPSGKKGKKKSKGKKKKKKSQSNSNQESVTKTVVAENIDKQEFDSNSSEPCVVTEESCQIEEVPVSDTPKTEMLREKDMSEDGSVNDQSGMGDKNKTDNSVSASSQNNESPSRLTGLFNKLKNVLSNKTDTENESSENTVEASVSMDTAVPLLSTEILPDGPSCCSEEAYETASDEEHINTTEQFFDTMSTEILGDEWRKSLDPTMDRREIFIQALATLRSDKAEKNQRKSLEIDLKHVDSEVTLRKNGRQKRSEGVQMSLLVDKATQTDSVSVVATGVQIQVDKLDFCVQYTVPSVDIETMTTPQEVQQNNSGSQEVQKNSIALQELQQNSVTLQDIQEQQVVPSNQEQNGECLQNLRSNQNVTVVQKRHKTVEMIQNSKKASKRNSMGENIDLLHSDSNRDSPITVMDATKTAPQSKITKLDENSTGGLKEETQNVPNLSVPSEQDTKVKAKKKPPPTMPKKHLNNALSPRSKQQPGFVFSPKNTWNSSTSTSFQFGSKSLPVKSNGTISSNLETLPITDPSSVLEQAAVKLSSDLTVSSSKASLDSNVSDISESKKVPPLTIETKPEIPAKPNFARPTLSNLQKTRKANPALSPRKKSLNGGSLMSPLSPRSPTSQSPVMSPRQRVSPPYMSPRSGRQSASQVDGKVAGRRQVKTNGDTKEHVRRLQDNPFIRKDSTHKVSTQGSFMQRCERTAGSKFLVPKDDENENQPKAFTDFSESDKKMFLSNSGIKEIIGKEKIASDLTQEKEIMSPSSKRDSSITMSEKSRGTVVSEQDPGTMSSRSEQAPATERMVNKIISSAAQVQAKLLGSSSTNNSLVTNQTEDVTTCEIATSQTDAAKFDYTKDTQSAVSKVMPPKQRTIKVTRSHVLGQTTPNSNVLETDFDAVVETRVRVNTPSDDAPSNGSQEHLKFAQEACNTLLTHDSDNNNSGRLDFKNIRSTIEDKLKSVPSRSGSASSTLSGSQSKEDLNRNGSLTSTHSESGSRDERVDNADEMSRVTMQEINTESMKGQNTSEKKRGSFRSKKDKQSVWDGMGQPKSPKSPTPESPSKKGNQKKDKKPSPPEKTAEHKHKSKLSLSFLKGKKK